MSDEPFLGKLRIADAGLDITSNTAANDIYEAVLEDDEEFNSENHDLETILLREERSSHKHLSWYRRPSVNVMAFFMFFIAVGAGSGMSAIQSVTLKLTCNLVSARSGGEVCDPVEVQSVMSDYQMASTIVSNIAMLITLGKVGALLDQYGRKPFLILILLFAFSGALIQLMIMINFDLLQFVPMLCCVIIISAAGGVVSLFTISNSYLADISEPSERVTALGMSTAAIFIGMSVGPLAGNLVLSLSTRTTASDIPDVNLTRISIPSHEFAPIKFEVLLLGLALIYTFFIPESRSLRSRRKSRSLVLIPTIVTTSYYESISNQVISIIKPLRMLMVRAEDLHPSLDRSKVANYRFTVLFLAFTDAVWTGLGPAVGEILVLYGFFAMNWEQSDVALLTTLASSTKAIVLIIISPMINHRLLQKRLNFKVIEHQFDMVDFSNLALGFTADAVGFILTYFCRNTNSIFALMPIKALGALTIPTLSSSIIKFYPESRVGEVYGALAIIKNFSGIILPVVYLSIYKYSLKQWSLPGFTFLLSAGLDIATILIMICVKNVLSLNSQLALEDVDGIL